MTGNVQLYLTEAGRTLPRMGGPLGGFARRVKVGDRQRQIAQRFEAHVPAILLRVEPAVRLHDPAQITGLGIAKPYHSHDELR